MTAMTASMVACVVTAIAGLAAGACVVPRRHLGYADSWISFAIGALAGTVLPEAFPHAWERLGSAGGALSLLLLGAASATGVVGGGAAAGQSLEAVQGAGPLLLVLASSMILYVALAELLPIPRSGGRAMITLRQAAFMLVGAIAVGGTHWMVEYVT